MVVESKVEELVEAPKEEKKTVTPIVSKDPDRYNKNILSTPVLRDVKSVTISLHGGRRVYEFKGAWTGNDVRLVLSSFFKEYRLYIRDNRRNGKGAFNPVMKPETKEE